MKEPVLGRPLEGLVVLPILAVLLSRDREKLSGGPCTPLRAAALPCRGEAVTTMSVLLSLLGLGTTGKEGRR